MSPADGQYIIAVELGTEVVTVYAYPHQTYREVLQGKIDLEGKNLVDEDHDIVSLDNRVGEGNQFLFVSKRSTSG